MIENLSHSELNKHSPPKFWKGSLIPPIPANKSIKVKSDFADDFLKNKNMNLTLRPHPGGYLKKSITKTHKLPKNVSIGSIVKKDNEIIPARGSSTIDPGDKLVMFVPVKSIKKVQELLSVRLDYF